MLAVLNLTILVVWLTAELVPVIADRLADFEAAVRRKHEDD